MVAITLSSMMMTGTMADSWFDDGDVAYAFGDSYDDQAGNDDNNNDDERDDDDFSYAFAT